MHYGIKGMKWGVRRVKKSSAVGDVKSNYKSAKKEYNRAYNKAYGYSSRHMIGQFTNKNKKTESDRLWEDAIEKANNLNKSTDAYKKAKKDARAKKRADKAMEKLRKTKIKDLEKRYGKLEDSMEYGRKADPRNNRKIQTEMNNIENEIRKIKDI